jgi:hypothetical protein
MSSGQPPGDSSEKSRPLTVKDEQIRRAMKKLAPKNKKSKRCFPEAIHGNSDRGYFDLATVVAQHSRPAVKQADGTNLRVVGQVVDNRLGATAKAIIVNQMVDLHLRDLISAGGVACPGHHQDVKADTERLINMDCLFSTMITPLQVDSIVS